VRQPSGRLKEANIRGHLPRGGLEAECFRAFLLIYPREGKTPRDRIPS
jgi:hypothetical protein